MDLRAIRYALLITLLLPITAFSGTKNTSSEKVQDTVIVDRGDTGSSEVTGMGDIKSSEAIYIGDGPSEVHVSTVYNMESSTSENGRGDKWRWLSPEAVGLYTVVILALTGLVAWLKYRASRFPVLQLGIVEDTAQATFQLRLNNISPAHAVAIVRVKLFYDGVNQVISSEAYREKRYWIRPANQNFAGFMRLPSLDNLAQCQDKEILVRAEAHYRRMPKRGWLRRKLFTLHSWQKRYIYSTPVLEWKLKVFTVNQKLVARWVPDIISDKIGSPILTDDTMLKTWPYRD